VFKLFTHISQDTRATHKQQTFDEAGEMASPDQSVENLAFSRWRYKHYFQFIEVRGKNVNVKCTLCPGPRAKTLSTSVLSNSNLMKHLTTTHASTKLVAKNTDTSTTYDSSSSTSKEGHEAKSSRQQKLDISALQQKPMTQAEVNLMIARYVVTNMLPLSTLEDDSFRAIIAKIPQKGGAYTNTLHKDAC
jgi:hypothetical protein